MSGTRPLPPSDRPRPGGAMSAWQDRGYSIRETVPQRIPDKLPYTAHLGNLSNDATVESVTDFFQGCDVVSVRIIEDREMQRPKGFGYVEFTHVDGLKKALDLDGQSFQGRMIKIKVADPPRGGDGRGESTRDLSDWTCKGPLPDLPGHGARQPSDFGDRPRDPAAAESRPAREMTWERRGPLSPLLQQESGPRSRDASCQRPAPEGLGEHSESYRGNRPSAGAWGEARQQEGSRPPRREQERVPSAAEKDMQWRERMRPDAHVKSSSSSRDGSEAPPSPSVPAAAPAPAGRPRLNLQKRTVSEATPDAAATPAGGDSKASPFGEARPIDTAAREKEIEEKRWHALQEKREAEEKAKEDRRLAKQAAATAEAEAAQESAGKEGASKEGVKEGAEEGEKPAEAKDNGEPTEMQNSGSAEQKVATRSREPREPRDHVSNYKPRSAEAGNWRSASNEQRLNRGPPSGSRGGRGGGAPRAARANGSPGAPAQQPAAGTPDDNGWMTVPNKKGRQGHPVAS